MSAVNVTVTEVGTDKVVAKFDSYVGRLRGELVTAMNVIVNTLVAYCKDEKLSGQVLHRRTGTLSRSIKGTVIDQPTQIVGNVTSRDKGNAQLAYAAFWEYGFSGSENVKAHIRKTASGGLSNVRSYVRQVSVEARPFLKPTKDENLGFINSTLQQAVSKVNKE